MERHFLRGTATLWLLLMSFAALQAQAPRIYASAATQDSLWAIDTTSYAVVQRWAPSLVGSTITGLPGLAYDPVDHQAYALLRVSALPNTTLLATINLSNGVCTQVGNLGMLFSAITFREDGQLFGTVGDGGGANAEKLFTINKTNATVQLATTLGNGDNGEVVCYHHDDGMLYHWSGSSTIIFEKLLAAAPYSPLTNIPTSGGSGGEISAALDLGNDDFITASTSNSLRHLSANGQYGSSLMNTSSTMSGLILPPRFSLADPFICLNEIATWNITGITSDTAVYSWGDGTVDYVFPPGPANHTYLNSGTYTSVASLKNGVSGNDTLATATVTVLALPGMFIAPSNDTVLCLADSLIITSSFGGTSRWYRNGVLIPGATSNIHPATLTGWYNMTKTNSNGCTDSAARGISVIFANDVPTPNISFDTTGCPTVLFQTNDPFANSWTWDFGDGGTANGPYPAHTYASVGTYLVHLQASNECYTASDSTTVVIGCFIGAANAAAIKCEIMPNPNRGHMVLSAHLAAAGSLSYAISDLSGRILQTHVEAGAQSEWTIPIDFRAPAGLYFLMLRAGELQTTLRLLIE